MSTLSCESYSLHKIYEDKNFPFSAVKYSRFKFGDKNIAREFGFALANGFIKEYLSISPVLGMSPPSQLVVVSSPYNFIPTATFAMKDYFIQKLNEYLVTNSHPVIQETKIHRVVTYKEDYGNLSAEERLQLIGNDSFHIDKEFIRGKVVLYLDDVKVTGGHEKVVKRMIREYGLANRSIFLYFAELINQSIPANIENVLNYYYVKDLLSINKIIRDSEFLPNTRVIKYILNSPIEECSSFLNYQPLKLLSTIYHLAIGNSYHLIEEYSSNLLSIKKLLLQNKLL